jgi:hypothetical protein
MCTYTICFSYLGNIRVKLLQVSSIEVNRLKICALTFNCLELFLLANFLQFSDQFRN